MFFEAFCDFCTSGWQRDPFLYDKMQYDDDVERKHTQTKQTKSAHFMLMLLCIQYALRWETNWRACVITDSGIESWY